MMLYYYGRNYFQKWIIFSKCKTFLFVAELLSLIVYYLGNFIQRQATDTFVCHKCSN